MKIDNHLERLRKFAMKRINLSGNHNVVAGLFDGKVMVGMAQNNQHYYHAETHLLRKQCILRV